MNEQRKYNNTRATLAIAMASFRSIIRSPSAVVFSLVFPLIFIVVFANIGGTGVTVDVGVAKTCDTSKSDFLYQALKQNKIINLITDQSTEEMNKNLSKGSIDAILNINYNSHYAIYPPLSALKSKPLYDINVTYTKASNKGGIFKSILNTTLANANKIMFEKIFGKHEEDSPAQLHETTIQGREYRYIDFILPGMLGFSLLSSGVFGTAFVFLSLRLTLVIKRFFATPVKRYSIVLGEALARVVFALLGALFIIAIGHYAFSFTLVHGLATVVDMIMLSAIGLIIFMGFGFIISGVAKNESAVPPFSNIITLPQFLLSGTFFSTSAFPGWLQSISRVLPLTHLNEAMRKVAFEGASLADVSHQLLILGAWFVGVYVVAVKTFKWE
jgi:ABC-2 type transport system permease protein